MVSKSFKFYALCVNPSEMDAELFLSNSEELFSLIVYERNGQNLFNASVGKISELYQSPQEVEKYRQEQIEKINSAINHTEEKILYLSAGIQDPRAIKNQQLLNSQQQDNKDILKAYQNAVIISVNLGVEISEVLSLGNKTIKI